MSNDTSATFDDISAANPNVAVAFPVSRFIVKAQAILSENFKGQPTQIISAGQTIDIPSMTIRFLTGVGQAGISSERFNVHFFPPSEGVSGTQHIRIEFKSIYSSIQFSYEKSNFSGHKAFFYAQDGQLLGERPFSIQHGGVNQVKFVSSGIARMDVVSARVDWIYMDDFIFEL